MYEMMKERIERLRPEFDRAVEVRSPETRRLADEYLDALTEYIRTYEDGPAADPHLAGIDTTGALARVEDHAAWAEQERHRVRRSLNDLS